MRRAGGSRGPAEDTTPHLRPVERIELSEKHKTLRLILTVVFLAIGVTALVLAVRRYFSVGTGWRTVDVNQIPPMGSSSELELQYDLSGGGAAASALYKRVAAVYTDAVAEGEQLFDCMAEEAGAEGLQNVNLHPGETVEVHPALYEAFELLEKADSRFLYYAPLYSLRRDLLACSEDWEARAFDPASDEDAGRFAREAAAFAEDPGAVSLDLLGEDRVRLNVSREYAAFAEENGVTAYLDFFWLKNAFLVDYCAQRLRAEGLTAGMLSSADGFVCSLGGSAEEFRIRIPDLADGTVYPAASIPCTGAMQASCLRLFPVGEDAYGRFYAADDGTVYTRFVSGTGAEPVLPAVTGFSRTAGCAEIALRLLPAMWEEDPLPVLETLPEAGIEYAYCADRTVFLSDASLPLEDLLEGEGFAYRRAF